MTKYIFSFVVALLIANFASAADFVEDCFGCDATLAANLAEIKGHGYPEGNHTVFVVNMEAPTAWQVELFVEVLEPDPQIGIGLKDVHVLSITNAPADVNSGLQYWKDIGIVGIHHPPSVDYVFDASDNSNVAAECPSAGHSSCAGLSTLLMAQPETVAYNTGLALIQQAWNRLAAMVTSSEFVPLRFLVLFPDGSSELWEFRTLGAGTAFRPVEQTAAAGNGQGTGGSSSYGGLQGWHTYFGGSSGPINVGHAVSSGGSSCSSGVSAVYDEEGYIVSITVTTVCN